MGAGRQAQEVAIKVDLHTQKWIVLDREFQMYKKIGALSNHKKFSFLILAVILNVFFRFIAVNPDTDVKLRPKGVPGIYHYHEGNERTIMIMDLVGPSGNSNQRVNIYLFIEFLNCLWFFFFLFFSGNNFGSSRWRKA